MSDRQLTQKPALDTHLDNNRSATATVGRMSNVTDAPITSPLRSCASSLGDRLTGGRDMFNPQRKESARERKSSQQCSRRQKEAAIQGSPIFFGLVSEDKSEKDQSRTICEIEERQAVISEANGRLRYGGMSKRELDFHGHGSSPEWLMIIDEAYDSASGSSLLRRRKIESTVVACICLPTHIRTLRKS